MSKIINIENILEHFFKEPNKWFHVRELARLKKLNPSTISKYLNKLNKENLVIKKSERNHLLFKANTESEDLKDYKKFFNIRLIKKSGLIEYIKKELHYPDIIILFGSFAKAENDTDSDIDLFVISNVKKQLNLEKFEKNLGKTIQIFVESPKDFINMQKNNKNLVNNILNGIILTGYIEVFK